MLVEVFVKLIVFVLAPITVLLQGKDKVFHFYVAFGAVFLGSWLWSGYWASMLTILFFILKEEIWDKILGFGHYDSRDLWWSMVGVIYGMFLYLILAANHILT